MALPFYKGSVQAQQRQDDYMTGGRLVSKGPRIGGVGTAIPMGSGFDPYPQSTVGGPQSSGNQVKSPFMPYRSPYGSSIYNPIVGGSQMAPNFIGDSMDTTQQPQFSTSGVLKSSASPTPVQPTSGQYQAQSRMDGQSVLNAGDSKGYTPDAPVSFGAEATAPSSVRQYKPAQVSPVDREMQLIEQNAKNRLELARNQSDMQKAALLQGANEQAYSQGIGKDTNAFWKMNQEAVDQSGMQSQNLMNEAFNMNAGEMQQEVGQRQDEQRALQLQILQGILDDPDAKAESKQQAANQLSTLAGFGAGSTGSTSLLGDVFAPENQKSEFAKANEAHMERLSNDFGIQNAPEWFVRATRDADPMTLNRMVQQLKNGTLTESGWNATQSVQGQITDAKSLENMTDEQLSSATQDPSTLEYIKTKVGPTQLDSKGWADYPTAGSVLFHQDVPYRAMGGASGGQVVKSIRDGSVYFFDDSHPDGIRMTAQSSMQVVNGQPTPVTVYYYDTGRRNRSGESERVTLQPDGTVKKIGVSNEDSGKILPSIGRSIRDLF